LIGFWGSVSGYNFVNAFATRFSLDFEEYIHKSEINWVHISGAEVTEKGKQFLLGNWITCPTIKTQVEVFFGMRIEE